MISRLKFISLTLTLLQWQWLAPEVIKISKYGYDIRSDIYSYGVLLYEIFTRRFPFEDDFADRYGKGQRMDKHAMIDSIWRDNLRPVLCESVCPAFCPYERDWTRLCCLIKKCWSSSPGDAELL